MDGMPIITLEVQGMKHAIKIALSEYTLSLDSTIKATLDSMCSDGNISAIVEAQARATIKSAIEKEVHEFFHRGKGRQAMRDAVVERLSEERLEAGEGE